jgi:LEA14-like dessication related protein
MPEEWGSSNRICVHLELNPECFIKGHEEILTRLILQDLSREVVNLLMRDRSEEIVEFFKEACRKRDKQEVAYHFACQLYEDLTKEGV